LATAAILAASQSYFANGAWDRWTQLRNLLHNRLHMIFFTHTTIIIFTLDKSKDIFTPMSLKKVKSVVSDALKRARQRVKRLEGALDRKEEKIRHLREENERLRQENEKLKGELKAARKPPAWAKPNKSRSKSSKPAKKKGPKKGHKPNKRQRPPEADQEVEITPLACPDCDHKLPKPTKWHDHTQIDIPMIAPSIVTNFKTGWS